MVLSSPFCSACGWSWSRTQSVNGDLEHRPLQVSGYPNYFGIFLRGRVYAAFKPETTLQCRNGGCVGRRGLVTNDCGS